MNPLKFRYTNYRGETSVRSVDPVHIYFGATRWHPEQQWLLEAYDLAKDENRVFAMKDIKEFLE